MIITWVTPEPVVLQQNPDHICLILMNNHVFKLFMACNHIVINIPITSRSLIFVCVLVAMTSMEAGCLPVLFYRYHTKNN